MSEPFLPTNQQKQIMKLVYNRDRTFSDLAGILHISVEEVHDLLGGKMVNFVYVDISTGKYPDYGPCSVSITRDGKAYIEDVMDQDRNRRMEVRHFWIGILFGGLLGWLLTAFGTPKDLYHFFEKLFR